MAGYSGTPLAKKLGIKTGHKIFLSGAPDNYLKLVAPLPDGVRFVARVGSDTDIAHLFANRRALLMKSLRAALARLKPDGAIWVSWPKKSSRQPTDITEDTIREIALPLGLEDIKVCAVNDTWSGLTPPAAGTLRSAQFAMLIAPYVYDAGRLPRSGRGVR